MLGDYKLMITFGFGGGCKISKVCHGSKDRINISKVRNVVTEIDHWGFENGRDPKNVDSQFHKVVQSTSDTF